MMGLNPFMQGDYGDFPPDGAQQNKADPPEISMPTRNRRTSQTQYDAPFWPDGAPKSDQPPESAAG